MSRRSTRAYTRRGRATVLAAGVVLTTVTAAPVLVPGSSGSLGGPVARAETVRISDGASARAPDRVAVGGKIKITGKGWRVPTAAEGSGGSVIAVKFDDGAVEATGPVTNPASGDPIADPTVVAALRAKANGSFAITVPVPGSAGWTAGTRHSVRLLSGKLLADDATRSVALSFDLVAGVAQPSPRPSSAVPTTAPSPSPAGSASADPGPNATLPVETKAAEPTSGASSPSSALSSSSAADGTASAPAPSSRAGSPATAPTGNSTPGARQRGANGQGQAPTESAEPARSQAVTEPDTESACDAGPEVMLAADTTVRGVPTADFGEALTLTGSGFCHPAGGGSVIAVQIDDGRVTRTDSTVDADRAIWQIIEADADGDLSAVVRVPEAHQTDPEFTDGLHRLRLVTGSPRTGDAVRSVRTGEFLVSAGNHAGVLPEPTSTPRPVNPAVALVGAKAGAVTATNVGSAVRIVVPDLEPGDWVFPYAFGGRGDSTDGISSMDGRPTSWLQLDANRSVELDAADLTVRGATVSRVSLQARDGTMMGWVQVAAASAGSASSTRPAAAEDSEPVAAPPTRHPRPLVLIVGGALLLIGLASGAVARHRRRRLIRELNEW